MADASGGSCFREILARTTGRARVVTQVRTRHLPWQGNQTTSPSVSDPHQPSPTGEIIQASYLPRTRSSPTIPIGAKPQWRLLPTVQLATEAGVSTRGATSRVYDSAWRSGAPAPAGRPAPRPASPKARAPARPPRTRAARKTGD